MASGLPRISTAQSRRLDPRALGRCLGGSHRCVVLPCPGGLPGCLTERLQPSEELGSGLCLAEKAVSRSQRERGQGKRRGTDWRTVVPGDLSCGFAAGTTQVGCGVPSI